MKTDKSERKARIESFAEGIKAKMTKQDLENFDHFVFYRFSLVPVFVDDYGQSYYFFYKGRMYGCGSYNPFPDDEVKRIVGWNKDIYDIVGSKKDFLWIEIFRERGWRRLFGGAYIYAKGDPMKLKIRCTIRTGRETAEKEISRFKEFLNSPERKAMLRKDDPNEKRNDVRLS
jgi:hypothetical protein